MVSHASLDNLGVGLQNLGLFSSSRGSLGFEAIAGMYQFHVAVYEIVDDPSLDSIISWSKSNKSFVIWDPKQLFKKKILRKFFCCNLSQFITELETYGFVRIMGSEHLEFGHKQYFVRGKPELLKKMRFQAALSRMKKSAKDAKARAEAENGSQHSVRGGQPWIIISANDARMRYKQIFGSSSTIAKTPLENRFQHLRI